MTNTLEFSQQLALSLYESTEEFPIYLEDAGTWLEYHDKATAKRAFLKCGFIEGLDYHIYAEPTTTGISANPKQKLNMTVDAFKHWGMLCGTEKGKQIRYYFLECEKLAKKVTESVNPALLECLNNMQREMKVLSARTKRLDEVEKVTNDNKGIKGVIDTQIEDMYSDDLEFTVREYLEYKGVGLVHLNTMRRRAIGFYRQGIQSEDLPKKNKEVVFKGNAIGYLDQALKTTLELD